MKQKETPGPGQYDIRKDLGGPKYPYIFYSVIWAFVLKKQLFEGSELKIGVICIEVQRNLDLEAIIYHRNLLMFQNICLITQKTF